MSPQRNHHADKPPQHNMANSNSVPYAPPIEPLLNSTNSPSYNKGQTVPQTPISQAQSRGMEQRSLQQKQQRNCHYSPKVSTPNKEFTNAHLQSPLKNTNNYQAQKKSPQYDANNMHSNYMNEDEVTTQPLQALELNEANNNAKFYQDREMMQSLFKNMTSEELSLNLDSMLHNLKEKLKGVSKEQIKQMFLHVLDERGLKEKKQANHHHHHYHQQQQQQSVNDILPNKHGNTFNIMSSGGNNNENTLFNKTKIQTNPHYRFAAIPNPYQSSDLQRKIELFDRGQVTNRNEETEYTDNQQQQQQQQQQRQPNEIANQPQQSKLNFSNNLAKETPVDKRKYLGKFNGNCEMNFLNKGLDYSNVSG